MHFYDWNGNLQIDTGSTSSIDLSCLPDLFRDIPHASIQKNDCRSGVFPDKQQCKRKDPLLSACERRGLKDRFPYCRNRNGRQHHRQYKKSKNTISFNAFAFETEAYQNRSQHACDNTEQGNDKCIGKSVKKQAVLPDVQIVLYSNKALAEPVILH